MDPLSTLGPVESESQQLKPRVAAPAADVAHAAFRKDLIAAIPKLRAFALSLASHADHADDLVQETLMKAWNHQESFQAGTNIKAWLFTILRNEYFSQLRKRKREVEDANGEYAGSVMTPGGQESQLDMADLRIALQQLPADQREAVVLVGASGFSYQEVAEICAVPVGTVKSRVNRARNKLAAILGVEAAEQVAGKAGD